MVRTGKSPKPFMIILSIFTSPLPQAVKELSPVLPENKNDAEGDSTLYSYDILGNVKTLVQHIKALVAADATNGKKRTAHGYYHYA